MYLMYSRSVPCWLGIWSMGSGTKSSTLGTIRGITPKMAYFSSISAMRASAGMAGKGNPLSFDWSISAVKSLPIKVRVEFEPLSPGAMWFSVMTPSINTLVEPFTTTAITTRMNNMGMPPVSRNKIFKGDCLSMLKVSLKPDWPTSTVFTSTSVNASITSRGGVRGMMGPMKRRNWTLSSTRYPRNAQRRSDVQDAPRNIHQVVRCDRAVGIANQPEDQRVGEIFRGD